MDEPARLLHALRGNAAAAGGHLPPDYSPYGTYTAADGTDVLLAIQNEREWAALCEHFLHRPELAADARFATGLARVAHRAELDAIVAGRFAQMNSGKAVTVLEGAGVASARVNSVSEFLAHRCSRSAAGGRTSRSPARWCRHCCPRPAWPG